MQSLMQSGTYRGVGQTWKFPPPPPPPPPGGAKKGRSPPPPPPLARVSICKLPRKPFSIYRGEEKIHLLMTTYRQFSVACVIDLLHLPIFQGSFPKYTQA